MITAREMTVTSCDGCRKETITHQGQMAPGLHGTISQQPNGPKGIDWYAHSSRCVGKAVQNVLSRAGESAAELEESNPVGA